MTAGSSEARYREIFVTMDEGFCVLRILLDEAGAPFDYLFVDTNPAFERHTGLHDAVGRTARELVPDLDEGWFERYGRVALTGDPERFESHAPAMHRWFSVYAWRIGPPERLEVALVFRDITDRKRAEETAEQSRAWFARVADTTPDIVFVLDVIDGRNVYSNRSMAQTLGYDPDALRQVDDVIGELIPAEDQPEVRAFYAAMADAEPGETRVLSHRARHSDGELRWIENRVTPFRWDADGRLREVLGVATDVTARRAAEAVLRESEERFRSMADTAPAVLWITDPSHACTFLSRSWYTMTGQTLEEALGIGWTRATHPDDEERVARTFLESAERRRPFSTEYRLRMADGSYRGVIDAARPRFGPDGEFLGYIGSVIDVQDLRDAQEASERSRVLLDAVLDAMPVGVIIADAEGQLVRWNRANDELWGIDGTEPPPGHAIDAYAAWKGWWLETGEPVAADEWALARALLRREVSTGDLVEIEPFDGSARRVMLNVGAPVLDDAGTLLGAVVAQTDITERIAAERALRESEERFRTLADNIAQFAWMADASGSLVWYNRRWFEYTGTTFEEMQGWGWQAVHHPDHLDRVVAKYSRCLATGSPWEDTFPLRGQDGSYRWFLSRAIPIRDAAGRVVRWFGTNTDVTEQRRAEEQLRDAQRLQAVGQLAGGMAHELNNLLCASMGMDAFALAALADDHPAARDLRESLKAQERAAKITAQVLSFSRRQVLIVKRFDAAAAVRELEPLLRQSLGRSQTLRLELTDGATVDTDRAQLEQALLNLVLNARDAMPEGGVVTVGVETVAADRADAEREGAGDLAPAAAYVRITVRDTGAGIGAEVAARAFEPFFTTKPPGSGTGLGLSQVYGFARQSGGTATIAGMPGGGTVVRLLLPAASLPAADAGAGTAAAAVGRAASPASAPGAVSPGRVLVIDDEPLLRAVIRRSLELEGYAVVDAASGGEGLELLAAQGQELDLVICDIVMPELGGEAVGGEIARRWPRLPVLYVSGHPGTDDLRRRLPGHARVLQKPFDHDTLIDRVRAAIGRLV